MNVKQSHANTIARRGELIVELFLQDLNPAFIALARELSFDFLVGFTNSHGGVNTCAVEVKATEKPIRERVLVSRSLYNRMVYSNIPVLLLAVDVKENHLYYAWPAPQMADNRNDVREIGIPVTEVDEHVKELLRHQLAGQQLAKSVQPGRIAGQLLAKPVQEN